MLLELSPQTAAPAPSAGAERQRALFCAPGDEAHLEELARGWSNLASARLLPEPSLRLFRAGRQTAELFAFEAGAALPRVHAWAGLRVGCLLGSDFLLPQLGAILAAKGIDLLLACGAPLPELCAARALECRVPLAAVLDSRGPRLWSAEGLPMPGPLLISPAETPASWPIRALPEPGPRQFSIQRHQRAGQPEHFDLLIETPAGLLTWALPAPPEELRRAQAPALPLHRWRYLSYEGPLRDDLGAVRLHDRGSARLLPQTDGYLLALDGQRFSGRLRLQRPPSDWLIELLGGADAGR